MVRICTGEVWVRSTLRSPFSSRRQEEGVVHLPRRVAGREVERREVEIVRLDVRPLGDREAHIGEDRRQLVDHLADRVDAAAGLGPLLDRQGDVDALGGEAALEGGLGERLPLGAIAAWTLSRRPLMRGPRSLRSSGVMAPRVFRSSETAPFLPSAATRTASSAASSPAAATWSSRSRSRWLRSVIGPWPRCGA